MKTFAIAFLLIVVFSSCGENQIRPTINTQLDDSNIPTQQSWDSKIIFTQKGVLKAILYSKHLMVFEKKHETLIDDMKIDFYNPAGERTSVLTSKKGRVDDITKNMFAIDSVVTVSDSGVTLRTDELMWVNKTQKIKTDRFVRIESPDEIIEGYGFESDPSLENYVIRNIIYSTEAKKNK